MTTLKEVTALVATLWPTPPWPKPVQVTWAESLSDVPPDLLAGAVRRYYDTDPSGFRPTPGRLRSLLHAPQIEGAEQGWSAFMRAVAHYAGRPTHETVDMPNFADPIVVAAVRALGGFRQFLGGIDAKERDYLRSRFIKAYRRAASGEAKPLEIDTGRNAALDGRGDGPAETRGLLGGR